MDDYAGYIDEMPRSRRGIAYSMDDMGDSFDDQPDSMTGGPPGYNTHDPSMYRNYPPQHDYSSYGAPC